MWGNQHPHIFPTFCVHKVIKWWRIVHAFNNLKAAPDPLKRRYRERTTLLMVWQKVPYFRSWIWRIFSIRSSCMNGTSCRWQYTPPLVCSGSDWWFYRGWAMPMVRVELQGSQNSSLFRYSDILNANNCEIGTLRSDSVKSYLFTTELVYCIIDCYLPTKFCVDNIVQFDYCLLVKFVSSRIHCS